MTGVTSALDAFLMSPQQRRLWKVSEGEAAYVSSCVLFVEGALAPAQVEESLLGLLDRHEVLRTGLRRPAGLGIPAQVIVPDCRPSLTVHDLRELPPDERERRVAACLAEERERGFDLESPPLLRAALLRLEDERQALALVLSAFVADDRSLDNLVAELRRSWAGEAPDPDDEPMQYADFSEWQNGFESEEGEEGREHWRTRGVRLPLEAMLPLGPIAGPLAVDQVAWRLGEDDASRLESAATAHGVELGDLLLAGWAALLRHRSGADELVIGHLAHGRKYEPLEGALGLYGRYLPRVCALAGETRIGELAARSRESAAEDEAWQETFTWEALGATGGELPVFPATFAMERIEAPGEAGGLALAVGSRTSAVDRFGVELRATRRAGGGLDLALRYDAGRFAAASAAALAARLDALLERLAAGGDPTVDELRAVGRPAAHSAGVERNDTAGPPAAATLQERFAEQVARTPRATALIAGDQEVSYEELGRRAAAVARRLAENGVRPGERVGLCGERSVDTVAGLLGIASAGCAFVYLDPDQPATRLALLAADAGVRTVLASRRARSLRTEAELDFETLPLEAGDALPEPLREVVAVPLQAPAYVVYTSGSTGEPKGVVTPQGAVVGYLDFIAETYGLRPDDVVLQLSSLSFDASIRDLVGPLLRGASVVLLDPERAKDPREMVRAVRRHGVNRLLSVVPTLLRALIGAAEAEGESAPVETLLTSGERLLAEDCRRARAVFGDGVEIINQYGPTECTLTSSWRRVPAAPAEVPWYGVPLGQPIRNARFHLLDETLDPVADAWPGELYIAGAGLSPGYVGRPGLTAERFLPEARGGERGSRMYRTGDRIRRLPDGDLEFLGRLDDQVKVRGVRVEPGEVETVLGRHPEVRQAVVVARGDDGETRLVAYAVPRREGSLVAAEALAHLRERLPDALVPSALVILPRFPLTRTGKVDRNALPAPEPERPDADRAGTASDPVQDMVAQIWAEILGHDHVGAHESFFSLGGHSLLATQAMARMRDLLEVQIPLQAVFEAPSPAEMAGRVREAMERGTRAQFPPPGPTDLEGPAPLSHGQMRIWFMERLDPGGRAWLLPEGLRLRGELDLGALRRGVDLLVERHEALRTDFPLVDGQPVPRVRTRVRVPLPVIDLSGLAGLDPARREAEAIRRIREVGLRPFDLEDGPLVRLLVVRLGRRDHVALVSLHHMVADGWSAGVFLQELVEVYGARVAGRPVVLPEIPFRYADFADWQRRWLESDAMREQLDYWRETLAGEPAPLDLADRPASGDTADAGDVEIEFSEELTRALHAVGRREGVTLFMTLLAGFFALLHRASGQTDLRIGNPVSGRNRPELDRIVGYFVNNLVLRADLSGDPTGSELLRRVRSLTLGAYAHQDLPFARLVEDLQAGAEGRQAAPFQVLFAFQSFPAPRDLDLALAIEALPVRGEQRIERDLALAFEENDGRLQGRLRYRSDRFDAARMERFAESLRQVLETLVEEPGRRLSELPILDGVVARREPAAAAADEPRPEAATGRSDRPARDASERWRDLSERGGKLSAAKQELLRKLLEGCKPAAGSESEPRSGPAPASAHAIPRRPGEEPVPLSFGQQRLWFLSRLEPDSVAYNVPAMLRLTGELDRRALWRALDEIVLRHEILRTTFEEGSGEEPVQRVAPSRAVALPLVDLRGLPPEPRPAHARRLAVEEARRPFDLARGPLLRVLLVQTADDEHVAALVMHHIVSDAWSARVLVGEIAPLYAAFLDDRPSPLPELPLQYGDYAHWQRRSLAPEVVEEHLEHWRRRLEGAPAVLSLPTDRPRPPVQSLRGATVPLRLGAGVEARVAELARGDGVTPFMVLLSALLAVLSRWSGQHDLSIGMPASGRDRVEIEPLIGFFLNTLVLRVGLDDDPDGRTLLARVKETVLDAQSHQAVPFERIVSELQPERNLAASPLFQVMFSLQSRSGGGGSGGTSLPGLEVQRISLGSVSSKFDLTFSLGETEDGLVGSVEYATDLFDRDTVTRLVRHFEAALGALLDDPSRPASELAATGEGQRHLVAVEWNDTGRRFGPEGSPALAHELFRAAARRTPDAPAVRQGGENVPYRRLAERSESLAAELRALGVGPGSVVALSVERSPALAAAVLGVLEAGAAYCPLDPGYPEERLRIMLEDSGASLVLTSGEAAGLPADPGVPVATLTADGDGLADDGGAVRVEPPAEPVAVTAEDLAYVIFTSGSTGRPKGVAMRHGALANLLAWQLGELGFGEPARVLQFASLSFDVSFQELFSTWASGGELVLVGEDERRDVERLAGTLADEGIERLFLPFVALDHLAEHVACGGVVPSELRQVVTAGERLQASPRVRELFAALPGCRLINQYGPSETHVVTSHALAEDPEGWPVLPPIGRPVANTAILLLDPALRPVPVGVAGELWVAGAHLARGYVARPAATAERFVPDPRGDGERMYRTGDLARWWPRGEIEFLGRNDHQVKVRGFRVEPEEIEALLSAHPAVAAAVVTVRGDGAAKRLVAHLTEAEAATADPADLREHLRSRLPAYMVPSAFVVLDALPLTPSGKVDRRALPDPEPAADDAGPSAAPAGPVEEILAAIWAEVLNVPRVSAGDSFFELGGHSLIATRVMSRLRDALEVEVPLRTIFDAPVLRDFAAAVEAELHGPGTPAPPIEPVPRDGRPLPLSFAQERLWFLEQLEPGRSTYNLPVALRLAGPFDLDRFGAALTGVARRHEALRTTFRSEDGAPVQEVAPAAEVPVPLHDLSGTPEAEREEAARDLALSESRRPFDLERGPVLRAAVIRLAPEDHVALLTLHHIVSDGWSLGLLVGEVASAYAAAGEASAPAPPEPPIQYADYALWQREWLHGEVLEEELEHWRRRLEGAPPVLELPADRPRAALRTGRSAVLSRRWGGEVTQAVHELARRRAATSFMVLLTAFQALLVRTTGQEDLSVGTPVAGRNRLETERLIGLFVNSLVLRADASGDPGFRELLDRNREVVLDAYAHQDLPFEKLVEHLRPERSLGHTPLFQVMLVLHNLPGGATRSADLDVEPFGLAAATTPFDLTLAFGESPDGLTLSLEYATDLFDEATVARLADHLERLVAGGAGKPELELSELPLLTPAEAEEIVAGSRGPEPAGTAERLHDLVRPHVEARPDAVAVAADGVALTYGELARRAGSLARRLEGRGVGAESRVALALDRSPELVVALLAVLEAGAAWVSLDPALPAERRAAILDDSGASVVLTRERWRGDPPAGGRAKVVAVDGNGGPEGADPADPVDRADPARGDSTAVVVYTSGSTGRPKGVALHHRSVATYAAAASRLFGVGPDDRVLQFASINFDTSIEEIFSALAGGGTLVLRSDDATRSVTLFVDELARHGVTVLDLPTAYWHELVDALSEDGLELPPGVRLTIVGGEEVRAERLAEWQRRVGADGRARLLNTYGPAEATVVATHRDLGEVDPAAGVPIGRPVEGAAVHLVGRRLELLPAGAIGEIAIGGTGVARGYEGLPARTAERFVPDPFSGTAGARLYRTGDLARRRSDGDLVFAGRADRQVKVRGYRVEPGEVEAALGRHPGVREAAVVTRRSDGGEVTLVAFYTGTADAEPSPEELRGFLRERVPEPMVPAVLAAVADLPLTSSGKIDRRALAELEVGSAPATDRVPPRDLLELALARIWTELLDLPEVGVRESFFDLGGHSLAAMRLVARIRRELERELPVADLFRYPTIEALAGRLRSSGPAPRRAPLVALRSGTEGSAPLFLVHPIGGNVLSYAALVREIGPEHPVYGLQTPAPDDRTEPWTIPAMAARYADEVVAARPEGPYRLAGWSLGGAVVFEMARRLRADGREVELAALVDPPAPGSGRRAKEEDVLSLFAQDLGALLGLSRDEVGAFVSGLGSVDEVLGALREARLSELLPPDLEVDELERRFELYRANHEALRSYRPEKTPGGFLVLHAEGGEKRAAGWAKLAPDGAERHEMKGDHYSILQSDGARGVALHIEEALRRSIRS